MKVRLNKTKRQHRRDRHELDKLRALCAEAYAVLGGALNVLEAPAELLLDNLLAAASGELLPHAVVPSIQVRPEVLALMAKAADPGPQDGGGGVSRAIRE